jgi:hypothetical protein
VCAASFLRHNIFLQQAKKITDTIETIQALTLRVGHTYLVGGQKKNQDFFKKKQKKLERKN